MFTTIIALFIGIAAFSTAQSTISLFIPGADVQPLVASIVGSDTLATTYAVECAPGTDSNDCGFNGVFTLTEGPSTAAYTLSSGYNNGSTSVLAFTGYFDCSLDGTTSGICTNSFGGDEANSPGMSTATLAATDITFMPVVITTGALSTVGGPTSAAVLSTAVPTVSKPLGISGTTIQSSGSSVRSSGGVPTQHTSTSTAGVSRMTGNAQRMIGVALIVAIAPLC